MNSAPAFGVMSVGDDNVRVVAYGHISLTVDGYEQGVRTDISETTVPALSEVTLYSRLDSPMPKPGVRLPISSGTAVAGSVTWAGEEPSEEMDFDPGPAPATAGEFDLASFLSLAPTANSFDPTPSSFDPTPSAFDPRSSSFAPEAPMVPAEPWDVGPKTADFGEDLQRFQHLFSRLGIEDPVEPVAVPDPEPEPFFGPAMVTEPKPEPVFTPEPVVWPAQAEAEDPGETQIRSFKDELAELRREMGPPTSADQAPDKERTSTFIDNFSWTSLPPLASTDAGLPRLVSAFDPPASALPVPGDEPTFYPESTETKVMPPQLLAASRLDEALVEPKMVEDKIELSSNPPYLVPGLQAMVPAEEPPGYGLSMSPHPLLEQVPDPSPHSDLFFAQSQLVAPELKPDSVYDPNPVQAPTWTPGAPMVSPPPPADSSQSPNLTVRKSDVIEAPIIAPSTVTVVAFTCEQGHFSPPYAIHCRSCGQTLNPHQPVLEVPRPILGVLKLWGGGSVQLDRGVVMGRNPRLIPGQPGPEASLLRIEDPNRDVSSQHCEVRLEDWFVTVRDLGSTNGTQVILPHRPPVALRANEPMALESGSRVVLANAFDFVFEVI
jgi:hypothetical protein